LPVSQINFVLQIRKLSKTKEKKERKEFVK
jgi:hypothetical protein